MKKRSRPDTLFNKYAQTYETSVNEAVRLSGEDATFFLRIKLEIMTKFLSAHPTQRGPFRVMDYGCGTGRMAAMLREFIPLSSYTGVDPSDESIAIARDNFSESGNLFMTLSEFNNAEPALFDLVISSVVFHHIPRSKRQDAAATIHRCLEPGGLFFLFEHNPLNPLTRKVVKDCVFDRGVELLYPREAVGLFQKGGFEDIRLKYFIFFPRFLKNLRHLEHYLQWLPLGAQYMVTGKNTAMQGTEVEYS